MKRVYVDLDDCYSLLTEHAQERWDDIDAHGKLEDFFNLVDEMFGEDVSLMEIDDYLKYEYEDIAERLGFEPYSEEELEESFIGKLNKQILSCLNEDDSNEEDVYVTMISTDGNDLELESQYTIIGNKLYNTNFPNSEPVVFDGPISDEDLQEYILNNEHYPVISITRDDEEIFCDDEYMEEDEFDEDNY